MVIFLKIFFLIQQIRGSETMISKMIEIGFFQHYTIKKLLYTNIFFSNFGHPLANIFSIRLIRGSTYTRENTVLISSNFWLSVRHRGKKCFLNFVNLSNWTNFNFFFKDNTTLKFRHNWTFIFAKVLEVLQITLKGRLG